MLSKSYITLRALGPGTAHTGPAYFLGDDSRAFSFAYYSNAVFISIYRGGSRIFI